MKIVSIWFLGIAGGTELLYGGVRGRGNLCEDNLSGMQTGGVKKES